MADVLARYQPPGTDAVRESFVASKAGLEQILAEAARLRTAVELVAPTGAALVVAPAGDGVVLGWFDARGQSMHSAGSADARGTVFFEYLSQHSEVPAGFVVPVELGTAAASEFVATGSPFVPGLAMEPD